MAQNSEALSDSKCTGCPKLIIVKEHASAHWLNITAGLSALEIHDSGHL